MQDILETIHNDLPDFSSNRALVVGVNGIDNSGKTTFCHTLATFLRQKYDSVEIIHLDNFHNPKQVRNMDTDPVQSYLENAFDYKLLINRLLEPMKQGRDVSTQITHLDLESDSYSTLVEYHINPDTILIIEGVLLFRSPINKYFDYRIFLDITFEEALKRATKRDMNLFGNELTERYKQKYIPAQKYYLDQYLPKKQADMIIDNEDFKKPIIKK